MESTEFVNKLQKYQEKWTKQTEQHMYTRHKDKELSPRPQPYQYSYMWETGHPDFFYWSDGHFVKK